MTAPSLIARLVSLAAVASLWATASAANVAAVATDPVESRWANTLPLEPVVSGEPVTAGDAVPEGVFGSVDPLLPSALQPDEVPPVVAMPASGDGLLGSILTVLLIGAAWRYYHSSAYRKLYEELYGPLDSY